MFHIFFILSFTLLQTLAHKCLSGQTNLTLPYLPSTAPRHDLISQDRQLQEDYESIRILTDFTYVPYDSEIQDYIQNQIVPSAISYFEAALKVNRLQNPLEAPEMCGNLSTPQYLIDGVEADLIILVGADYYDAEFVAMAAPCALSEDDNRPVVGSLLFNLNYLPMVTVAEDQENLSTALHEIMHILAFGNELFEYFIDPVTKEPLTGHTGTKIINGVETSYINVEPLTSRLRAYFDCDTLEGAYLENEGEAGTIGSHFERKVFMNEFMTASSVTDPVISEFALALLEGSGWYQVDYNMAEPFNWGRGEGCPFLDEPCVDANAQPNFPDFCGPLGNTGCTYTGRAAASCDTDPFTDNCPYYVGFSNVDCENPADQSNAFLNEEIYGATSKCFTGTLVPSEYVPQFSTYCFATLCLQQDDGNFIITLTMGDEAVACEQEGPISVNGLEGELNCPDPNTFCVTSNPQYCEKGCSGRGICVENVCQCPEGWEGTDCAERRFDDNCSKCDGMTGCYGDICGCDSNTQTCQVNEFEKQGSLLPNEVLRKILRDHVESLLLTAADRPRN